MDASRKNCALELRRKIFRQEQVGGPCQSVTGGWMAGDVDAERAQLLHHAPHRRAAYPDFVGDLGSADHHGGMVGEQANNASQSLVGGTSLFRAGCRSSGDTAILCGGKGITKGREVPEIRDSFCKRRSSCCTMALKGSEKSLSNTRKSAWIAIVVGFLLSTSLFFLAYATRNDF